ncbi:MAG: chemotaxis protein CheW [Thermanaerothrix sp.]|nr:chemotaxis protein CheW [Thermanaerothrix sp.]
MRRRDKLSRAIDQLFSTEAKKSAVGETHVPEVPIFDWGEKPIVARAQDATAVDEGGQTLSNLQDLNAVDGERANRTAVIENNLNPPEEKKQGVNPNATLPSFQSDEQLVVFGLGDGMYGLQVEKVEAIIKMQPITRVPKTPVFVRGVTNLRGAVLPVIDLNLRLGRAQTPESPDSRIIVVRSSWGLAGLVVDRVDSVRRVPGNLIEPPPAMTRSSGVAYLRGVARLEDYLVLLLDLDSMLQVTGSRGSGKGFYGTRPAQATLSLGNSTR